MTLTRNVKTLLFIIVAGASTVVLWLATATIAQANAAQARSERSHHRLTARVVENNQPPRRPAPTVRASAPPRPIPNRPTPKRPEPARPNPPEPNRPTPNRPPAPHQ